MPAADYRLGGKQSKKRPPRKVAPVLAQSLAQERQYASQGKAVEKVAKTQKAAAGTRQREVKDTKGAADLQRAHGQTKVRDGHVFSFKPKKRGLSVKGGPTGEWVTVDKGRERGMTVGEANPDRARRQAAVVAPALKVLDQTTRPVHAIAGGVRAAVKGENVARAAGRGAALKDRFLFSDVLREAGVKGPLASVAGFALDVAADPTTYTTLGTGSLAKSAAAKAAGSVERKALKAGVGEQAAQTAAREHARSVLRAAVKAGEDPQEARKLAHEAGQEVGEKVRKEAVTKLAGSAGRRAAEKAPAGSGLAVRVAGHPLPGVTRATAAVGRGAKRAAAAAPQGVRGAGATAKDIVREVRPTLAPAGADPAQHLVSRQAARRARASLNNAHADNQAYARALQKQVGRGNYEQVIKAIETGRVGDLRTASPKLHEAAVTLRSRFRHSKRLRSQAGLGEGTIRDYFPHARQDNLESGLGISDVPVGGERRGGGRTISLPDSARVRADKQPLHELNPQRAAEGKVPFSTNAPLVALNYLDETARTTSKANLLKDLAKAGRPLARNRPVALKDGEAVYHMGFEPGGRASHKLAEAKGGAEVTLRSPRGRGVFGLREVDDAEAARAAAGKGRSGQYVVLNRQVVDNALQSSRPATAKQASGRVFDRATGTWKRFATATPGFHVRNLIGDVQMGYLEQPGQLLPRNLGQAAKAVRRSSQIDRGQRKLALGQQTTKQTLKVAGKRQNLDEFLAGAREHGVLDAGYVGRQLEDLTGPATRSSKRVRKGAGGTVKRWMRNRENLLRLATYKHGLDRGMTEPEAADLANKIHIDYGDVTETERRVLRRAAPFYTFTARAGPLHVEKLVTRPGKFANLEKAREEVGRASTGEDELTQRKRLQEYQQRQLPFVVKIGDGPKALSAALPANLLNEVPTKLSPSYFDELGKFGFSMLNPALKVPAELYQNQSFYFRKPLEDPQRPLVAAPGWVAHVPKKYWGKLGITPDFVDTRTGKKVWGWNGKTDYLVKQAPGPFYLANQLLTKGANRRGQGSAAKAIVGASGVRSDPLDAQAEQSLQIVGLAKRLAALNRRAGALNQQGVNSKTPTAEYRKIRGEITRLGKVLDATKSSGTPAKPDPETQKLLREARESGATAQPSPAEIQKLLREAALSAP